MSNDAVISNSQGISEEYKKGIKELIRKLFVRKNISSLNCLLNGEKLSPTEEISEPQLQVRAMVAKDVFLNVESYDSSLLRSAIAFNATEIVSLFFELQPNVTEEIKVNVARTAVAHGNIETLRLIYPQINNKLEELLCFAFFIKNVSAIQYLLQFNNSKLQSRKLEETAVLRDYFNIDYLTIKKYADLITAICESLSNEPQEDLSASKKLFDSLRDEQVRGNPDLYVETRNVDAHLKLAELLKIILTLPDDNNILLGNNTQVALSLIPYLENCYVSGVLLEILNDLEVDNSGAICRFLRVVLDFAEQFGNALPFEGLSYLSKPIINFAESIIDMLQLRRDFAVASNCAAPVMAPSAEENQLKSRVTEQLGLTQWRGMVAAFMHKAVNELGFKEVATRNETQSKATITRKPAVM